MREHVQLSAPWRVSKSDETDVFFDVITLPAEASVAHAVVSRDVEMFISRHFANDYFALPILPSCHPEFHHEWLNEIKQLMVTQKSLYYSVLAMLHPKYT